jgi:hypothetical protein
VVAEDHDAALLVVNAKLQMRVEAEILDIGSTFVRESYMDQKQHQSRNHIFERFNH